VPVRELGTHRLAIAICSARPVAQAPAGRSPMALPQTGSGQLSRAHLNGFAAARPGCARMRHGAYHARPADELARAARPRRRSGAADAQHRLRKRAPRTSPLIRDRLCACPSARVPAQAHQAGIGTASPAARPARADRLQMRPGSSGHHGDRGRTHPGHGAGSRPGPPTRGPCQQPSPAGRPDPTMRAGSHPVVTAVLRCCTRGPAFRIMCLTCGAMGIRTPDLLHASQWQPVHPRPSPQVTVPERP